MANLQLLYNKMAQNKIAFFQEDIAFDLPYPQKLMASWVSKVIIQEKYHLVNLSFIFCSDDYLFDKNETFLKHNTLTDVITFSYTKRPLILEGEIYISIERVQENALIYQSNFKEELNRVMIHGVLHLLGYADTTREEKDKMNDKENTYLNFLKKLIIKKKS